MGGYERVVNIFEIKLVWIEIGIGVFSWIRLYLSYASCVCVKLRLEAAQLCKSLIQNILLLHKYVDLKQ